jgi:hypothetical protein
MGGADRPGLVRLLMVRLIINRGAFAQLAGANGDIDAGTRQVAGRVRDRARQILTEAGRVDTGKLRQSIVVQSGSRASDYRIGSELEYAIYQHEGVRGPVYPRRARVLRFKPKRTGAPGLDRNRTFVFRPRARGFEGVPFLTRAVTEVMRSL